MPEMSEKKKRKIEDAIVLVFLIILALLAASQIDDWAGTITGMASSTSGINTSLAIYSDTDSINRSQGEPTRFYANYTNLTGTPIDNQSYGGSCMINFTATSQAYSMEFNLSGTEVYEYTRTFAIPGTYAWNVTCNSTLYETLEIDDSSTINRTYCGKYVSSSINLTDDLIMLNGSTECSQHGLIINASDITIDCRDYNITGTDNGYGIYSNGFSNATIINCSLISFTHGIHLESSYNNLIYYNNFISNTLHAYADNPNSSFNTTVGGEPRGNYWDNTAQLMIFDSDADNYGDFGQQYPYNSTNGGKVTVNVTDWGPVASQLDSDNDGSPDTEDCAPLDNTILAPRNDIQILTNATLCAGTYNINDEVLTGVIRFGADNLELSCNNAILVGNKLGSGIYDSYDNNTIKDCIVSDYYYGIRLSQADNTNLTNLSVKNTDYAGIALFNSSNCSLTDITARDNSNIGVWLTLYSARNNLSDISAYNNSVGIYLYYSDNNTVFDTVSFDNNWYGIFLERSERNTVMRGYCSGSLTALICSTSLPMITQDQA
jgi:parallel beta-helix repeat protein